MGSYLFAYWVGCSCFGRLLLLFSFKKRFLEKLFSEIPSVSNNLYPDQARRFVAPDLNPNYVHMLTAEDASRQRV